MGGISRPDFFPGEKNTMKVQNINQPLTVIVTMKA